MGQRYIRTTRIHEYTNTRIHKYTTTQTTQSVSCSHRHGIVLKILIESQPSREHGGRADGCANRHFTKGEKVRRLNF
jgi:hypothetical protein